MVCMSCGFIYHHSPAPAAAGIIQYKHQIILTKRAREPQKGLLTIPGGLLEYEENFENALVRELWEELNITITAPTYLYSYWGKYLFGDVVYFTTIAYFVINMEDITNMKANDDVENFFLFRPSDIDPGELAFDGDRIALEKYKTFNVMGG
jgi:NAD+ diphosphatase